MGGFSIEKNTLLLEEMLEREWLQRQQDNFCDVTGLFAYSVDVNGQPITKISGDKEQVQQIQDRIDQEHFQNLFRKIAEGDLEEQIIEDTNYANVKIAVISIASGEKNRKPLFFSFIVGVMEDGHFKLGEQNILTGMKTITEAKFEKSIDLIKDIYKKIYNTLSSVKSAEAESRRSKFSQLEMEQSLKRIETMTEIVQLLESDESIEYLLEKLLLICGQYLQISSAQIFRLRRDGETVDILSQWYQKEIPPLFEQGKPIRRNCLLSSEKLVVINYDTTMSDEEKAVFRQLSQKAIVTIPIVINGFISIYVEFNEQIKERSWKTEEIKFIHDAVRIMQSIILKRIQKNSLASSYASLEAILDNVGSAIYVKDIESGQVLFANETMKRNFEKEMKEGTLEELLTHDVPEGKIAGKCEIYYDVRNRWYDLYFTYINWVDGRKVALYAVYEITDKKAYQKKIEQQAYTDFLTGLYNRMCCERDLQCHIEKSQKEGTNGALLYLDLDDFKHINDGLGHQYGDVLLKSIAHSMQSIEGIHDTCYRMGGDEFVIILPPENYDKFDFVVEKIKEIFNRPWFLKDADYYCTMSMGVVHFPSESDNVQNLIKKADIAMYEAKRGGKNRVASYSDSIGSGSTQRLDMEKNMRAATADGFREFLVYFQPIIDNKKEGRPCTGAEALIRWDSVELGFISPGDFIPLAEYLGLINPIGNYVLREACRCCNEWNVSGHPDYKVNVNLSVVQLLQPDIVKAVADALRETGLNPNNLTLEVTESLAINDTERMKVILSNIKELGVRIALDDFGTGYSSLNHIREFPFDVIKVDQSFVKGLAQDSFSQSFIKMVSELAEVMGVNVCVEGIETEEQYQMIELMKVRLIQGFYFDRPMSKENFENKYVYADKLE